MSVFWILITVNVLLVVWNLFLLRANRRRLQKLRKLQAELEEQLRQAHNLGDSLAQGWPGLRESGRQ